MKIAIIVVSVVTLVWCQDIYFHNSHSDEVNNEKKVLIPEIDPEKCPGNQYKYPENEYDYTCDCAPGFLYYPPRNECFAAYQKGPCPSGKYLMIRPHTRNVDCLRNPCRDGYARYKDNRCYQLNQPNGPCKPISQGGGIFRVNVTTLELECSNVQVDGLALFGNIPKNCPIGSKRDRTDRCQQNWNTTK